ncbi:hypothetical protein BSL78_16725 [Apostichopus japonicus]|uniref:Uncharacterized protein n=1 Tax=Stichopus japonicus TaxID=307972 RepID=A0A2G8KEH6_STIJA|nr:hypothetical protein BSL78_16725 [Apostichopus japonicus]
MSESEKTPQEIESSILHGGETITFRCEDVRYQILDGPIHNNVLTGNGLNELQDVETTERTHVKLDLRDTQSGSNFKFESSSTNLLIPLFCYTRCSQQISDAHTGKCFKWQWAYVRATGNTLNPHAYILNEKVTSNVTLVITHPVTKNHGVTTKGNGHRHYRLVYRLITTYIIISSPTVIWIEEGVTLHPPSINVTIYLYCEIVS